MALAIPYFLTAIAMFIISHGVPNLPLGYHEEGTNFRKSQVVKFWVFLLFILLVSICAFKQVSAESVDEYAYRNRFDRYYGLSFNEAMEECEGEYINGILVWISTRLFESNQGIFVVFGTLTAFFYIKAIRKFSKDFSFGIALLLVMGIIYTSFNITQQSLACAIFVCYSDLIYKKKLWKYLIVVIVCIFIHKASIVLLLFYLFSSSKLASGKGKIYIVLFSFVFILMYKNVGIIAENFDFLAQYVDIAEGGSDRGIKAITILINCVPALVSLLFLREIDEEDRITGLAVNMSFMHAAIYLAGTFDRYIARLGMYTEPFCLILLSRFAVLLRNEKYYQIFKYIAIILYSIELYLRFKNDRFEYNFDVLKGIF